MNEGAVDGAEEEGVAGEDGEDGEGFSHAMVFSVEGEGVGDSLGQDMVGGGI